jgi:hypothetical protein
MKTSFAHTIKKPGSEQAKIVSVDKLSGRVGIFLRNGLITSATYLYDIDDLRVGMNVLIGRVSNTYVIMNKVSNMSRTGVSYSIARTGVSYSIARPEVVEPPAPGYWDDDFTGADGSDLNPDKWDRFGINMAIYNNRIEIRSIGDDALLSRGFLAIPTNSFTVSIKTGIVAGTPQFLFGGFHVSGFYFNFFPSTAPGLYSYGSLLFYQKLDEYTSEKFLEAWTYDLIKEEYLEAAQISLNSAVESYYLKVSHASGVFSFYYSVDDISYTYYGSLVTVNYPYSTCGLYLYNYPSGDLPAADCVYIDDFKYISGAPPEEPKYSAPPEG